MKTQVLSRILNTAYIYIYIWVCVCVVCGCVCMWVWVYVCVALHIYQSINLNIITHGDVSIHRHIYMYVCVCVCVNCKQSNKTVNNKGTITIDCRKNFYRLNNFTVLDTGKCRAICQYILHFKARYKTG